MSKFQIKAVTFCAELLWWAGLGGLIAQSFQEGLSVGVIMVSAMCGSAKLISTLNHMAIKATRRLLLEELDKPRPAQPYQ